MAKTITPTTQYDTHLHIFGSGALMYSWWNLVKDTSPGDYLADPATFDGWEVTVSEYNLEKHESRRPVTLNHGKIMAAIRRASKAQGKVSDSCAREARNFLFNRDDTDFDSDKADQIIQLAMFGEVVYG